MDAQAFQAAAERSALQVRVEKIHPNREAPRLMLTALDAKGVVHGLWVGPDSYSLEHPKTGAVLTPHSRQRARVRAAFRLGCVLAGVLLGATSCLADDYRVTDRRGLLKGYVIEQPDGRYRLTDRRGLLKGFVVPTPGGATLTDRRGFVKQKGTIVHVSPSTHN